MSRRTPPRLLDLAIQSGLQDEDSVLAALDWLPRELFPPLFVSAFARGHGEVVKAMILQWPFPQLALGALMRKVDYPQAMVTAAMEGDETLRSQTVRHSRCRLRSVDFSDQTATNFWDVWAGPQCTGTGPVSSQELSPD
ncbi:PRAME family member 20-like [Echinops telfairi]|uniref:PRAME family member 20-like n=2 Tax=Echinops telfairi TaxID=9371 RepID=A0AC55D4U2_ECHTE|nr:PRAME family member 20-like [Echinops telfairi]XP_045146762.1 PRAME family member 20-like [Echinops telfairi]